MFVKLFLINVTRKLICAQAAQLSVFPAHNSDNFLEMKTKNKIISGSFSRTDNSVSRFGINCQQNGS
jgi:hypothetical protein